MTPEIDAAILRDHSRLRVHILRLATVTIGDQELVSRKAVLRILRVTEPDKPVTPIRSAVIKLEQ